MNKISESRSEMENSFTKGLLQFFFLYFFILLVLFESFVCRSQKCVSAHLWICFSSEWGILFFGVQKGLFLRGFSRISSSANFRVSFCYTTSSHHRSVHRPWNTTNLYIFRKYSSRAFQKYILWWVYELSEVIKNRVQVDWISMIWKRMFGSCKIRKFTQLALSIWSLLRARRPIKVYIFEKLLMITF